MGRKVAPLLIVIALNCLGASGCSTPEDALEARGTGSSRIYGAPFEGVWSKAKVAVADVGLRIISESEEEGRILARNGLGYDYDKVAVFVERADRGRTSVEVVSLEDYFLQPDWEKSILCRLTALVPAK
jgi:hypothetical protein